MTEEPAMGPRGIDVEHPNAARVYDALLGGNTNFAIDRSFAEKAVQNLPMVQTLAWANREFLGRAVQYLGRQGVTQFLDLGSGVPTAGNVHEVADEVDKDSRCVYVDFEPVAAAHCRLVLEDRGDPQRHAIIEDDMRNVEDVWAKASVTGVLDPTRPIGLIMVTVLHFVSERDAHAVVQRYRDLLAPGSYLVISHVTEDGVPDDLLPGLRKFVAQYDTSSTPAYFRDRRDIAAFFGDFDMVEPGLVWLPQWRLADRDCPASRQLADAPERACGVGGVARKPR